ncbi:MAG TPA: GGDEF domain-containing protein [Methanocorpusculum sp.]|nr:GGDEF domain-containing protein [Methanocorpusculum sp.]
MATLAQWFYGGKDKEFFIRHSEEIRLANTKTAGTFGIVITALVLLFTIFVCASRLETDLTALFIFTAVLLVLNIYYWVWGREHPKLTVYYIQVILLILIAFLILRDIMEPEEYAVFIPLFLIVMPLLFINPMHKTLISMLVVLAGFACITILVKGPTVYGIYDIVDVCITASFGFFMGQNILRLRIGTIEAYEKLKQSSESEVSKALDMANTDALTGVRSRSAYEKICATLDEKIQEGTASEFALVLCDVNGLKKTNDTMGHEMGDKLIKSCCHEICVVYAHSPVFRIGGDEFVVLLHDSDYMDRKALFEKLHEANMKTNVSFAYGMAEFDSQRDARTQHVFARADAQMYLCKKKMKAARSD